MLLSLFTNAMDAESMLQLEWDTPDMKIQNYICTFKLLLLRNNPDLAAETTNFRHDVNGREMVSKGILVYDARLGQDVRIGIVPYYRDEALNMDRYTFAVHNNDLIRIWTTIAADMGYIAGCGWNSQLFADSMGAAFRELVSERHLA